MATQDIRVLRSGDDSSQVPVRYIVLAGATTINQGELVERALGAANVTATNTGAPIVGTDFIVGLAAGASTQTATVDGFVDVLPLVPGQVFTAVPTTPANFDTQAEYSARVGRRVGLTLASGVYTIDDTDGATNGLVISYLDITDPGTKNRVAFSIRNGASALA